MGYKIITVVTAEPVTTTEAKAHLRIASTDTAEDASIGALITTAREYCEGYTRRALAEQTIEMYLDGFPWKYEIELARPPLQSVTSVKYKDSDGTETTMTADVDYIVDADSNVGRIVLPYGKLWPSFTPYTVNPIKIRYVAGYNASNLIPKTIKQAMLLLIGHWYLNREATGKVEGEIGFAVKTLLSLHKVRWF